MIYSWLNDQLVIPTSSRQNFPQQVVRPLPARPLPRNTYNPISSPTGNFYGNGSIYNNNENSPYRKWPPSNRAVSPPSYRDQSLSYRDQSLNYRDEMFGNRDFSLSNRDDHFGNRDQSPIKQNQLISNRDEMFGNRDFSLSNRDDLFGNRDQPLNYRDDPAKYRAQLPRQQTSLDLTAFTDLFGTSVIQQKLEIFSLDDPVAGPSQPPQGPGNEPELPMDPSFGFIADGLSSLSLRENNQNCKENSKKIPTTPEVVHSSPIKKSIFVQENKIWLSWKHITIMVTTLCVTMKLVSVTSSFPYVSRNWPWALPIIRNLVLGDVVQFLFECVTIKFYIGTLQKEKICSTIVDNLYHFYVIRYH